MAIRYTGRHAHNHSEGPSRARDKVEEACMRIEPEAIQSETPGGNERSAAERGAALRTAGDEVGRVRERLGKCPYLAGRPPCGTHHLFPSRVNVCWAERSQAKPYHTISVITPQQ